MEDLFKEIEQYIEEKRQAKILNPRYPTMAHLLHLITGEPVENFPDEVCDEIGKHLIGRKIVIEGEEEVL